MPDKEPEFDSMITEEGYDDSGGQYEAAVEEYPSVGEDDADDSGESEGTAGDKAGEDGADSEGGSGDDPAGTVEGDAKEDGDKPADETIPEDGDGKTADGATEEGVEEDQAEEALTKFTVDGNELALTQKEIQERFDQAGHLHERETKALASQKMVDETVQQLFQDPMGAMEKILTEKYAGDRARARQEIQNMSVAALQRQIELDNMPAEEKLQIQHNEELQALRNENAELRGLNEQEKAEAAKADAYNDAVIQMKPAMEAAKLQNTTTNQRMIADLMVENEGLSPNHAARIVKNELDSMATAHIKEMTVEDLNALRPDLAEHERTSAIEKVKDSKSRNVTSKKEPEPERREEDEQRTLSMEEQDNLFSEAY